MPQKTINGVPIAYGEYDKHTVKQNAKTVWRIWWNVGSPLHLSNARGRYPAYYRRNSNAGQGARFTNEDAFNKKLEELKKDKNITKIVAVKQEPVFLFEVPEKDLYVL